MTKLLPLAAMEKLLKAAGASRVSEEAKVALRETIEDIAKDIAERASKFAQHSGRKTIKSSDVKLAARG